jgi:hypothetical protein
LPALPLEEMVSTLEGLMNQENKDNFDRLRIFLNNHADAGESTWEESEALEAIYTDFEAALNALKVKA